jgi:hypothetical protein
MLAFTFRAGHMSVIGAGNQHFKVAITFFTCIFVNWHKFPPFYDRVSEPDLLAEGAADSFRFDIEPFII